MGYDEQLADRVRPLLKGIDGVSERKMFGGLAFMVRGHRCCGVLKQRLMLRLGTSGAETAQRQPNVEPMDFTGKPMRSMVYIHPDGIRTTANLSRWVRLAIAHAQLLPPK